MNEFITLIEEYKKAMSIYRDQISFYEKTAERIIEFVVLFHGLYFATISFSELKQIQSVLHLSMEFIALFFLPLGFLFLAMSSAMYVILMKKGPEPYLPEEEQGEILERRSEILNKWKNWRNKKLKALCWSYIFTALAFLSLFIAMGVYLVYLPGTP